MANNVYYICIPDFFSIYLKHTCVYITKLHGMQMVFTVFIKEMITSILGQRKFFQILKFPRSDHYVISTYLSHDVNQSSFQFPIKCKFQDNPPRIGLSPIGLYICK